MRATLAFNGINESDYTYHKDFENVHESGPPILSQWKLKIKLKNSSYLEKKEYEKEKRTIKGEHKRASIFQTSYHFSSQAGIIYNI